MHDQGVELAVDPFVEVVYRQQVVTAIGKEQLLASEGAVRSSNT